ncbi:hypothetical protein HS088_TW11G00701 [Tripterygium wilfordii]|uniref:Uncharacterized protein n=1 Tax=Tripterygium wilfordii TaxID=458696 RepID=A0A7J7D2Q3_TRIWF|nr:uncharacterized protein LOC120009665 [Tripterygium wilfordii]KAF5740624.1 hypothetical protein HS088_TW11G00701 [Tripterygium wilfordii]
MKISGSWILCLLIVTAVMLLNLSSSRTSSSIADVLFTGNNGYSSRRTTTIAGRKLKELSNDETSINHGMNLDDYHPIDPVPSSKASIRPGPIEHGTPINPFIPRPSPPPNHPTDGGST